MFSWVASRTMGQAAPACWTCSQRAAQTHQRSPGLRPAKPYWGMGVERSLPRALEACEEGSVDDAADGVDAEVVGAGLAAAGAVEAGHRLTAADVERLAENVLAAVFDGFDGGHGSSLRPRCATADCRRACGQSYFAASASCCWYSSYGPLWSVMRKSVGPPSKCQMRVPASSMQVFVVGDEEDGAFVLLDGLVEGVDGFEVEVVGGFVEDEDVGLLQHDLAEEQPGGFASGERVGLLQALFALEEHLAEDAADVFLGGSRDRTDAASRRRSCPGGWSRCGPGRSSRWRLRGPT